MQAQTVLSTHASTARASSSLWARLFTAQSIDSLVYFRIIFGAIMAWEVCRYWTLGRIARYYIEPTFHFTYYGFEWVQPLAGSGMFILFAVLGALAVCITLGLFYRLSTVLFFLGFTYVFLLDQALYLNHFYLICLVSFLLIFVPANRAFSLDAWFSPKLRSDSTPTWTLWLLRAQIGLVYFFGGIAKLNGDWLQGEPMRMWLGERLTFPLIGELFTHEWMIYAFSYGGLLFDLLFFPLVLWRRTRMLVLVVATGFHLMNSQLFSIGIFPWMMIAANLIFLPAGTFTGLARRLRLVSNDTAETHKPSAQNSTVQKLVVAALAGYFAIQVFLPVRHFLYPGDVNWTEEGHRFSWHMKLRDKAGIVRFYVTEPQSQTVWEVHPLDYLTEWQFDEMATRPDMIQQFAHYLAQSVADYSGIENVEVRVLAQVSLNGRAPQALIDPTVDLATQPRTLFSASWIIPLNTPLVVGER